MQNVMSLVLSFIVGLTFGGFLAFLRFRSKLKFYKYIVEQRLHGIDQRFNQSHAPAHEHSH